MKMYKEVFNCRACEGTLTQVLDLGTQYVVDFVKKPDENLLKAPLTLMKCDKCHLVQLGHSVEPDRLYKKFWYRSGINEQMRDELLLIVQKAQKTVELKEGDKVLDIGCNDGTLLGWYKKGVTTFGVDPCAELVAEGIQENRIDVGIADYFSLKALSNITMKLGMGNVPMKFKIITAIAMFYDLENPLQFLNDCKAVLHNEGVLVIQMNYLYSMLKNTAFDNISHEHLGYYSVSTLKKLVERAGLELQGVELTPCNGGSFRAYITQKKFDGFCMKDHQQKVWLWTHALQRMQNEQEVGLEDLKTYKAFGLDIEEKMDQLTQYLTGRRVYVCGASTRGTVLMQYLYESSEVVRGAFVGVAERDPKKFGLHMVGTWLPIVSEAEARADCDEMVVLPYHFKESIVNREKKWIESGGSLIFPLPSLEIFEGHPTERAEVKR